MHRFMGLMVLLVLVAFCTAQLNFSTGWGKRAANGTPIGTTDTGCKVSIDTLMLIYKLIQNEAQKLQECEKFAN